MSRKRSAEKREPFKTICLFNHKGGVGKTVLTANLAHAMARMNKRVLLVDADPQCNLTSYFVDAEEVDLLLDSSDSVKGRTVWSALRPVLEGTALAPKPVATIELPVEGLYLLPGDIQMYRFESELNEAWLGFVRRDARAIAVTTALSHLISGLATKLDVDYVFVDPGPNIGALNRVVLLDADYFVSPMACDLFSMRALKTMGRSLAAWIAEWHRMAMLAPTDAHLLKGSPRFLGYVVGKVRVYGGRLSGSQSSILSMLDNAVRAEVTNVMGAAASNSMGFLGQIPDLGDAMNKAQLAGKPVWETVPKSRRSEVQGAFDAIASKIIDGAQ